MLSLRPSTLIRILLASTAVAAVVWWQWQKYDRKHIPNRVGVLVATSGPRAEFDRPTLDGILAAIEVRNASVRDAGSRPIEAVVRDTKGDPVVAANEATRLAKDGVGVLIGGISGEVRRAIERACEPLGAVLVSPSSAEGLDASAALVTVGTLPNQRAVPAAGWAVRTLGPRIYLIGSDQLTQRVAHAILADHVRVVGGEIVGRALIKDDAKDMPAALEAIAKAKPDAIVSGLEKSGAIALAKGLRAAGTTSVSLPTVSWQLRFAEAGEIGASLNAGDYFVVSQFAEDVDTSSAFATAYQARSGGERPDARVLAAAAAVALVAQAFDNTGGTDPKSVLAAMLGTSVRTVGVPLTVHAASHAAWKSAIIGKIGDDGSVAEVWSSNGPIRPRPWPPWRSRAAWTAFVAAPAERTP